MTYSTKPVYNEVVIGEGFIAVNLFTELCTKRAFDFDLIHYIKNQLHSYAFFTVSIWWNMKWEITFHCQIWEEALPYYWPCFDIVHTRSTRMLVQKSNLICPKLLSESTFFKKGCRLKALFNCTLMYYGYLPKSPHSNMHGKKSSGSRSVVVVLL